MTERNIKIKDIDIPLIEVGALVIGSGCAGLNAADWLYDFKVDNVALVTEGMKLGTSRNTGSDKQTYYKLSLSSSETDSVRDMAESLFAGGAMNGDTALVEAACSARGFIKLANLGVPFPTNIYGEYIGYMTDHDVHKRATSAGPLTSKFMTEALEKSVKNKDIKIFDNTVIIKLLVNDGKIIGALGISKEKLYEESKGLVIFASNNVVLATGGPAGIYKNSVYPYCHTGMSGLAVEAGAETANLQEWQYGLASVDFRWNVSGTYQQVLPRYIAVDDDGNEREFLNEYFENPADAVNYVFQKGYQWPFDTAKIKGSSVIDMIIFNETVNKKNKVYMDFTREPSTLENGFDCLSEEAGDYLKNSDALVALPIERLKIMNPKAIELYKNNGIDLCTEPLRVEVCAQHNNGGVAVDINWETSIKGLYAAGEVAGTFGIYRPGGTALNSTQVGSLRAAEAIALRKDMCSNVSDSTFEASLGDELVSFLINVKDGKEFKNELNLKKDAFSKKMSDYAAYIRVPEKMKELRAEVMAEYNALLENYSGADVCNLPALFKFRDMLLSQAAVLSSMIESAEKIGTRGGALVCDCVPGEKDVFEPGFKKPTELALKAVKGCYENGEFKCSVSDVRPIPESDLWFEKVWNDYLEKRVLEIR